jgi:hypothetical protein
MHAAVSWGILAQYAAHSSQVPADTGWAVDRLIAMSAKAAARERMRLFMNVSWF